MNAEQRKAPRNLRLNNSDVKQVFRILIGRRWGFRKPFFLLFIVVIFPRTEKAACGWTPPMALQGIGSLALGLLITMHVLAQEPGPPPSALQQSRHRPGFLQSQD